VSLHEIAARQLSDFDRRRPGSIFADHSFSPSLEFAYDLQFQVARLREARGESVAGYKVGCNSRTMQAQLGLDRPDFGHLWESELRACGSVRPIDAYDSLAIEDEFAIRLAADVPSVRWLRDHPEALASGFVVIELHNYVFRGLEAGRVAELVANNAIHAGVVLPSTETPLNGFGGRPDGVLRVRRNGEVLGEAAWSQLEGGPLAGIERLVEHLQQRGRRLLRGQIVLTGSPLPLWRVSSGDVVEVDSDPFGSSVCVIGGGTTDFPDS
jgi:2-keto-4-pentenoate hydratase